MWQNVYEEWSELTKNRYHGVGLPGVNSIRVHKNSPQRVFLRSTRYAHFQKGVTPKNIPNYTVSYKISVLLVVPFKRNCPNI